MRGICPCLILAKEPSKISIKTMPLAPSKPPVKKKIWSNAVTTAVVVIIKAILLEPYFSSSSGPINKISEKFPSKWFQSACPSICVNILIQLIGLKSDASGWSVKKKYVVASLVIEPSKRAAKAASVKVSMTGAL